MSNEANENLGAKMANVALNPAVEAKQKGEEIAIMSATGGAGSDMSALGAETSASSKPSKQGSWITAAMNHQTEKKEEQQYETEQQQQSSMSYKP